MSISAYSAMSAFAATPTGTQGLWVPAASESAFAALAGGLGSRRAWNADTLDSQLEARLSRSDLLDQVLHDVSEESGGSAVASELTTLALEQLAQRGGVWAVLQARGLTPMVLDLI